MDHGGSGCDPIIASGFRDEKKKCHASSRAEPLGEAGRSFWPRPTEKRNHANNGEGIRELGRPPWRATVGDRLSRRKPGNGSGWDYGVEN
jgi:hypothetical protein